jgi:hypothetical protein
MYSSVLPSFELAVAPFTFSKKIIIYINSYGEKFYMKIVDLDEIYNFSLQIFFFWNHIRAQVIIIRFQIKIFEEQSCRSRRGL